VVPCGRLRVVTVDSVDWPPARRSTDADMSALTLVMSPVVVAAEALGPPIQVSMPRPVVRMVSGELARWPSVRVDMEAWEGRPSAVLLERSEDAAMVVVGARGSGGFAGLRLGSVAQQVLHHASCPAVVARPGRRFEQRDGSGRVVVGWNIREGLSDGQLAKIRFSVLEARLRKTSLEVVAVKPGLGKLRRLGRLSSSDVAQAEDALAKRLMNEADTTGINLMVEMRQGSVAGELAKLGEDAELLVIGSGTGGIEPGTVRQQVVHYAHCPVAVHRKRSSLPGITPG
jgi:nucleotide-binding universal stress UspA family protein